MEGDGTPDLAGIRSAISDRADSENAAGCCEQVLAALLHSRLVMKGANNCQPEKGLECTLLIITAALLPLIAECSLQHTLLPPYNVRFSILRQLRTSLLKYDHLMVK